MFGYVPSRLLYELLNLNHGNDFAWTDTTGLAVVDPTVGMDDAAALVVRRDLAATLGDRGYTLFWTVLLNKQRHDHAFGSNAEDDYRWLSASASYILAATRIERVAAVATRRRPGSGGEPISWDPRGG